MEEQDTRDGHEDGDTVRATGKKKAMNISKAWSLDPHAIVTYARLDRLGYQLSKAGYAMITWTAPGK